MANQLNSATLRQWACDCTTRADNPDIAGDERTRLLKMKVALQELAEGQDWLDGQTLPSSEKRTA